MSHKDYPVGAAQQIILNALSLTATGFTDADRQFEKLGLVVSYRREGRQSVPVVTVKSRFGGGFSGGDGDSWREYDNVDLSAIQQWISK